MHALRKISRVITCQVPFTAVTVNRSQRSQQSNARCLRSSHHNFTKENTDKCRKFHLNRKTWRCFWKRKLFSLSVCSKWISCHAPVLPALVCQASFPYKLRARKQTSMLWNPRPLEQEDDAARSSERILVLGAKKTNSSTTFPSQRLDECYLFWRI